MWPFCNHAGYRQLTMLMVFVDHIRPSLHKPSEGAAALNPRRQGNALPIHLQQS